MTTTSASCLSATPRATVAPTFPAPPTTVTLRFMSTPENQPRKHENTKKTLHVIDDGTPELRRLQFLRAVHEAGEVVRHRFGADRAVHALHDQVSGLVPAHVAEHHFA